MKKTVVVGDVHGCYKELMLLLEKFNYNPSEHDLVLVGDLVDRGPDSKEVVRWVMENQNQVSCVAGNHDDKHFRYYKHRLKREKNPNYVIPLHFGFEKLAVYNSLSDEELTFLGTLPGYVHFPDNNWVVVHAGLQPGKLLDDQDFGKMTHLRFMNPETGKTAALNKDRNPPPGSVYWTELYDLPYNVVYGHSVRSLRAAHVTRKNGISLVGVDTGACFGGHLTAFFLPEKNEDVTPDHFVQVPALGKYSELWNGVE